MAHIVEKESSRRVPFSPLGLLKSYIINTSRLPLKELVGKRKERTKIMHNPISNDILRAFDARDDKVEFIVEDLPFGSPERAAALKEYLNKLDVIHDEVKDLIFENSDFRHEEHGREIFENVFSCAIDEAGDMCSWIDVYEWFCEFEDLVAVALGISAGKGFPDDVGTYTMNIPDYVIAEFREGEEGWSKVENAKKFLSMLYSNSRFPEIPYGKKLHDHVVERVDNVMCDHWDFEEFAMWYSYYENMVITALRQSWGKDCEEII